MRCLVLVVSVFLLSLPACAGELKPAKWQKDLRELKEQLVERHVDPFHSVSREEFEAAASDLEERIPTLTQPEILVGIAQLVAMVGDGHTSFYPGNQKKKWFRFYPIQLWSFSDGIYVIATTPEHSDLYGKRLVRIGDTPIEEAYRRISTTIGADNAMEYEYSAPYQMNRPELLHALRIAQSADRADFHFEGGTRKTFRPLSLKEYRAQKRTTANELYGGEFPPSLRLEFLFATPLVLEHLKQRKYYWFTWIPEERALFFQYNACWNQKDRPTFADISDELFRAMEERPVERLVIDLRQNTGGEPLIAKPLIEGLAGRSEFADEGRLFVLVGRRTFSAALTNAAELRSRAGARIVGEAPRGKPNSPSEGRDIELKRTKIWLSVSTQFVERDAELGDAEFLPVEIEAPLSFEQFRKGQDPALEAALSAELYLVE
ncbi:hypothetical protein ABI59_16880 [Acidobacteria bacterium Mor1]|nr:hypothetical protein ABI59_16880 [Acidobacteria bacterium Mor1]